MPKTDRKSLPGNLLLLHGSLGDIVFRCPSCTAERQAACPKLTTSCEIVREPGCGCCPVCARQKGELCGVYTPRCGSGLRCYPSANSELPLEQLIQGLGRCENKVDLEPTMTNQESGHSGELNGTRSPPVKKPGKENNYQHIKEIAVKQHLNNKRTRMYSSQDDLKTPHPRQLNINFPNTVFWGSDLRALLSWAKQGAAIMRDIGKKRRNGRQEWSLMPMPVLAE
ncbi:hypothetical protein QQF64_032817, partial [Cirrhinus molitorella]